MSTLLVVGDGPVSRALAPMAELVGWSAVLVTSMPEVAAVMPEADAVVVTSHHDEVDAPTLRAALEQGTAYIGSTSSPASTDRPVSTSAPTPRRRSRWPSWPGEAFCPTG